MTQSSAKPEPLVIVNPDGSISYPVWWKTGSGMTIRRECLEPDHPQHPYALIKGAGLVPEEYGVYDYDVEAKNKYMAMSKEQLIGEILRLEKTILSYERAGF